MVPFKSPKSNQDLITNLPEIVIDKILKRLPIKMVAKMSILSKKWRLIWLSHKHLIFNKKFWDELRDDNRDYQSMIIKCNCIISNIFFNHVGPVHKFLMYVPCYNDDLYVSGWVSLLSKIGVKKIALLIKFNGYAPMPPSIYHCKDLVKLEIESCTLNRAPSDFNGFPYLRSLKLFEVEFKHDVFRSLIANCPRLTALNLLFWTCMNDRLVIDVPSLEHLNIFGDFETIVFKNVRHLSFMSLYLNKENGIIKAEGVDDSLEMLASSCQLQELHFGGLMCKYFGAGCIKFPHTLKSLRRLLLTSVDLSDFDQFRFTRAMLQCCIFIKDLHISVNSQNSEIEHKFGYNKNYELRDLVKVKITSLRGSISEIKLVEYLLSMATNLEKMSFQFYILDPVKELKVTQDLLRLPRASPKAKLVCF